MALAKGHSKIRCGPLSDRTKTAIFVVKHLTNVKFQITEIPFNSTTIIECDGLGYQRQF
jgi:RNA 3'-terminal phosphate cyclase (ATP)